MTTDLDKNETRPHSQTETAIFGAGCFWGVEEIFQEITGVILTTVGYCGGTTTQPTYQEISMGNTGHAEAVQIEFDPDTVDYDTLLDYFFRLHDPTTQNRQGNDIGSQYRSIIFYQSAAQQRAAEAKKQAVDASGKWQNPVVTDIVAAQPFYSAEDYHQDYLKKIPVGIVATI
jgi:peptide-methionine (S)-S-oxide reductase